jgi:hypothetical protein
VYPPTGANIIKCKWVYKAKKNEKGEIVRYKARLVAKGFTQVYGQDYTDTFSPVTRMTSIRTFLAIAAMNDWELENLDVDTAFLNADIEEEIFMQQPEGFVIESEDRSARSKLVYRLRKSIYGLKQASHNWNKVIDTWLQQYGLKATQSDPCVYVKEDPRNENTMMVLLWVDDLILGGNSKTALSKFKKDIGDRFKIKDLGSLTWILGMEVLRDRVTRTIELRQSSHIDQMLIKFGMNQCKPVATPIEGDLHRLKEGLPDHTYMSMVGSLLYTAIVTRPDIAFAVQALGRHMQSSDGSHLTAAKRVLRYLKGTREVGIKFSGGSTEVIGYSDSDWGGDN